MKATVTLVVVALAGVVALFAPMHSGERGLETCHQEGFSEPGTVSWWPPGARCVGGQPTFESVVLNNDFIAAAVGLLAVAVIAGRFVDRRLAKR